MRRRTCVAIIAVFILCVFGAVGKAKAQTHLVDGNVLVDRFKNWEKSNASPENTDSIVFGKGLQFAGYVQGVVDSTASIMCYPSGVKGGQIFAVVGNYLMAHPERWNESGAVIVYSALSEAFPCPKK